MSEKKFTILVPFVPHEFRTEWHPTEDVGPFAVLNRGAFGTIGEAITWAREHLNGTPYSIRPIEDDREPQIERTPEDITRFQRDMERIGRRIGK